MTSAQNLLHLLVDITFMLWLVTICAIEYPCGKLLSLIIGEHLMGMIPNDDGTRFLQCPVKCGARERREQARALALSRFLAMLLTPCNCFQKLPLVHSI